MILHPTNQGMIPLRGLVLVLVLINLLAPSSTVRADIGPQPVLPGGSSIKPGEETPIQMVAEIVVMNVRTATEADNNLLKLNPHIYGFSQPSWYTVIADVEADFTMQNPTSESVRMTVWFPLASALENAGWSSGRPGEIAPRIETFQVSVGGNPLDYTVSKLPNPSGADKPPLPWASFPVTFPAQEETIIHVSYMLPLQPAHTGNEVALYYVFQTGAGWAGSIGQAELIVNLPYPASTETLAGKRKTYSRVISHPILEPLPSGAVLEGNQARWTWKDFEPGPENDFEIWLLRPGKWEELEAARAAVEAHPEDGQAWLDLASTYHSLSLYWTNVYLLFSPSYLQPCLEAYQKASELLPEHPAPHVALGLFTLVPYLSEKDAPPEVIQFVQGELQIARELEASNPSLTNKAGISSDNLENALRDYFYNDATATVDAVNRAVYDATQTAEATINYATRAAWAVEKAAGLASRATEMACWAIAEADCTATAPPTTTLTSKPTLTATPFPSATPQPLPTTLPTSSPTTSMLTAETRGDGRGLVIIVIAIVISLVVVGYLALIRSRNREGEKKT